MKSRRPLKISGPMIEIIIGIGIFAFASALILRMFLITYSTETRSKDVSQSIMAAQTVAECLQNADSVEGFVTVLGVDESKDNGRYTVSLDETFKPTTKSPEFIINIDITSSKKEQGEMMDMNVIINKTTPYPFQKSKSNQQLFELTTSKYITK